MDNIYPKQEFKKGRGEVKFVTFFAKLSDYLNHMERQKFQDASNLRKELKLFIRNEKIIAKLTSLKYAYRDVTYYVKDNSYKFFLFLVD
jgi:hypothetical protein